MSKISGKHSPNASAKSVSGSAAEPNKHNAIVQLVTYPSEVIYADGERARYRVRIVNSYGARAPSTVLNTGFAFCGIAAAEQVQAAMYSALRTAGIATGLDFLDW